MRVGRDSGRGKSACGRGGRGCGRGGRGCGREGVDSVREGLACVREGCSCGRGDPACGRRSSLSALYIARHHPRVKNVGTQRMSLYLPASNPSQGRLALSVALVFASDVMSGWGWGGETLLRLQVDYNRCLTSGDSTETPSRLQLMPH